jgi:hypothetical protein
MYADSASLLTSTSVTCVHVHCQIYGSSQLLKLGHKHKGNAHLALSVKHFHTSSYSTFEPTELWLSQPSTSVTLPMFPAIPKQRTVISFLLHNRHIINKNGFTVLVAPLPVNSSSHLSSTKRSLSWQLPWVVTCLHSSPTNLMHKASGVYASIGALILQKGVDICR